MGFEQDIERFRELVERRMEVVVPIAIKSMYRQFLDLEPVWSGLLIFNYTFSIGTPAAGVIGDTRGTGGKIDRGGAIASAKAGYLGDIPDTLPPGGTFYITNNVEYAMRIEQEGSPRGYGWHALQATTQAWRRHVKLGVADAVAQVNP